MDPSKSSQPPESGNPPAFRAPTEDERTFRALTESSVDAVIRYDRSGRHLYVNPRVERATGKAKEFYIGKTHRELGYPPELCELWETSIKRTIEERSAQRIEFQLPNGPWVDLLFAPELDESGEVLAVISSARDITERKQMELALRESEHKFRALAENAHDVIMRFDREHRHLYVNPAVETLTGIPPGRFFGKTHREIGFPEELCALWERVIDDTFRDANVHRIEFQIPSGVWFDWMLAPEVGPAGEVTAVISSARDITARKQEEAAREERAKERVLEERRTRYVEQVISAQEAERRRVARELHDVTGQTLTGLLVGLRTLEDLALPEQARERVGKLRELTSSALEEVATLARGLHPSVLDDYGLVEALKRLAATMSLGQTEVELQVVGFDGGERLPAALETTLYRVAQEALTNAARHANATHVSVVLDRGPDAVRLVVEDNGRGFDVASVLTEARGLGLRGISERIALLQGQVTFESKPGNGTAVYARIPNPAPTAADVV